MKCMMACCSSDKWEYWSFRTAFGFCAEYAEMFPLAVSFFLREEPPVAEGYQNPRNHI